MISIFYISRLNFSTKKAHLHNIVKTCESLAGTEGFRAVLVSTARGLQPEETEDFLKEHNIKREFPIVALNSLANRFQASPLKPFNWLEVILANFSLMRFLFAKRKELNIVYLRDQHLFLAMVFGAEFTALYSPSSTMVFFTLKP